MRRLAALAALGFALAPPPAAAKDFCRAQEFAGEGYSVCAFDVKADPLRLYWLDSAGLPYASLGALTRALEDKGQTLAFGMNAGMFKPDASPVGLYVEGGRQLRKADTKAGRANFRLLPNGVFWIGMGEAGVTETTRYLAAPPNAVYATQSGPMLVIDGKLHPRIHSNGTSLKIRNGVCVKDKTQVSFAISDGPVTFYAFATLFRDALHCKDALFLDGSVSSLYAPTFGRSDQLEVLGPLVGLAAPKDATKP